VGFGIGTEDRSFGHGDSLKLIFKIESKQPDVTRFDVQLVYGKRRKGKGKRIVLIINLEGGNNYT
jgi:hypothetical protein